MSGTDKCQASTPCCNNMGRRLPVYLLIDTSGSMRGEPIESVKVGIDSLKNLCWHVLKRWR